MPDELKPQDGTTTAPVSQPPQAPEKSSDAHGGDDSAAKTFSADYVKELRDEAAKWRKEFRTLESKLSTFEQSKTEAEEAKLKEQNQYKELLDKRTKEFELLKADLEKERLSNLRLRIGSELGLSAALQSRLVGSTEEELREDAKGLMTALGLDKPKAETSAPAQATTTPTPDNKARSQTTAVAPDGKPTGETDEQRRARLYARGAANSPLFQSNNRS